MDESGLQYTLGAGTLLGAMRNEPPGLLQWEHDVDVYVLARQASLLLRKLQARPPAAPRTARLPRTAHQERSAPNERHPTRGGAQRGPRRAAPPHRLRRMLQADCSPTSPAAWRSRYCSTLLLEGLMDREGRPCCGFGFKIFHRRTAACELDVLVLGRAAAPYLHAETPLWPLGCTWWAAPLHALHAALLRLGGGGGGGGGGGAPQAS